MEKACHVMVPKILTNDKHFSKTMNQRRVGLWLVYKIVKNNCCLPLFTVVT